MSQQQFIMLTNVLLRVSVVVVSSHVWDGATIPDSGWLLLLWSLSGPGSSVCHVTLGPRHQPSPQRVTVTKRVGHTRKTRKTRDFCLQQDPKKSSMKTNHKPTILTKSPSLLLSQKKSIVFHGIWESTNPFSVNQLQYSFSQLRQLCIYFSFWWNGIGWLHFLQTYKNLEFHANNLGTRWKQIELIQTFKNSSIFANVIRTLIIQVQRTFTFYVTI